jgi:hypothetical protein
MRAKHLINILIVTAVGLTFSLLPYLFESDWIADADELVAMNLSASSYHNHLLSLDDAVHTNNSPSLYPWLQIVPATIVTKVLNLGPDKVGIVWRAFAGFFVSLAWYVLFFFLFRSSGWALGATLLCLSDAGYRGGLPLVRHAWLSLKVLSNHGAELFSLYPQIYVQWRLITPALSLGALILHVLFVLRALEKPTRARLFCAAASFGLLVYFYFYFWTAAGLALALGFALLKQHRRTYFAVGALGLVIGLPVLIQNFLIKRSFSDDYLHRNDLFQPISHFQDLLFPLKAIGLLLLLTYWIRRFKPSLAYILLLCWSGFILLNHQLLTGLQIQNFHYSYIFDPLLFATVIVFVQWLTKTWPKPWFNKYVGFILCASIVLSGLSLRFHEVTKTAETKQLTSQLKSYKAQRMTPDAPKISGNIVVAGDPVFIDLSITLENLRPLRGYAVQMSAPVRDQEWHEREALNAILLGETREVFKANQEHVAQAFHWGRWQRESDGKVKFVSERLNAYDHVIAHLGSRLLDFQVRYAAIPSGQTVSPALIERFQKIQSGPYWDLWERH